MSPWSHIGLHLNHLFYVARMPLILRSEGSCVEKAKSHAILAEAMVPALFVTDDRLITI
jgi:hypothetical protein